MSIQHRDIPDGQRHEVKGASSAAGGAVLVADGSGNTNFQKLGVANMTGSIPTGVANIPIVTDGTGGFKAGTPIYGRFSHTFTAPSTHTITLDFASGISIVSNAVVVSETGVYAFTSNGTTYVTTPSEGISVPSLINADSNTTVLFGDGLVQLQAGVRYRTDVTDKFSLYKVA